jgi:hypothetical protein
LLIEQSDSAAKKTEDLFSQESVSGVELPDWCVEQLQYLAKLGAGELKRRAYLTRPMRRMLRAERAGFKNLNNVPILEHMTKNPGGEYQIDGQKG